MHVDSNSPTLTSMLQVSLILQVKENELIIKRLPIMVPNIASGKYIYLSLFVCFCFYFYDFFISLTVTHMKYSTISISFQFCFVLIFHHLGWSAMGSWCLNDNQFQLCIDLADYEQKPDVPSEVL